MGMHDAALFHLLLYKRENIPDSDVLTYLNPLPYYSTNCFIDVFALHPTKNEFGLSLYSVADTPIQNVSP
jgi:hypothetical protein